MFLKLVCITIPFVLIINGQNTIPNRGTNGMYLAPSNDQESYAQYIRNQLATQRANAFLQSAKLAQQQNVAALKTTVNEVDEEELNDGGEDEQDIYLAADENTTEDEIKKAYYTFTSSIDDTINDQSIMREETRDGMALTGMYSYTDGYFRRTVHYEADENGYRVVKDDIEPIGNGPQFNPDGKANVSSSLGGNYSITTDDFVHNTKQEEIIKQANKTN